MARRLRYVGGKAAFDVEKVMSKLEKLKRLAADQKGTSEGETAARLARKLMRQYALKEAEGGGVADDRIERRDGVETGSATWRRSLFNSVSRHHGCRAIYIRSTGLCSVVGFEADVELTLYVYFVAEREISRGAAKYGETVPRASKRRLCADFRTAAVAGFGEKLYDIRVADATAEARDLLHALDPPRMLLARNAYRASKNEDAPDLEALARWVGLQLLCGMTLDEIWTVPSGTELVMKRTARVQKRYDELFPDATHSRSRARRGESEAGREFGKRITVRSGLGGRGEAGPSGLIG